MLAYIYMNLLNVFSTVVPMQSQKQMSTLNLASLPLSIVSTLCYGFFLDFKPRQTLMLDLPHITNMLFVAMLLFIDTYLQLQYESRKQSHEILEYQLIRLMLAQVVADKNIGQMEVGWLVFGFEFTHQCCCKRMKEVQPRARSWFWFFTKIHFIGLQMYILCLICRCKNKRKEKKQYNQFSCFEQCFHPLKYFYDIFHCLCSYLLSLQLLLLGFPKTFMMILKSLFMCISFRYFILLFLSHSVVNLFCPRQLIHCLNNVTQVFRTMLNQQRCCSFIK